VVEEWKWRARRAIDFHEVRRWGGWARRSHRVDDEHVFDLLEAGRSIISRQLAEQQEILQDLESS
jgi:hypothetical protein